MASGDLRDELNCSICLSLYTDPVSLRCGHNFCRSCIVEVLDKQDGSGGYSCPDCRAEYPERPALEKNRKLGNIVERFLSTRPEETRIFCAYCDSPVPAVRSCLQCENSLCEKHLTAHNKTMDHVLLEPTGSFGNKKCPVHKKVLEYYCPQDAACLCVSCCLVGKHRGHQVELLDEASEKKKEELRKHLEELDSQKEEIQARAQNLQDKKRNIQEKASDKRENVSKIFMDIKRQLDMAEKKAQSEISRQEEKILSQICHQIQKLERKEDELFRKMRHVEEMCQVTDPIRLLQEGDITVRSGGEAEDMDEKAEDMDEEAEDMDVEAEDLDEEDEDLDEEDEDLDEEDEDLDEEDEDLDEEAEDDDESSEDLDEEAEDLKKELQDLKEDAKDMFEDLDEMAEDLHEEAEDLDNEAEDLNKEVEDLHEEAENLHEEAENLHEKAEDDDEEPEDLDEFLISLTLHRSLRDIVTSVTSQLGFHVPDILLDEDTANEYVELSEDLKTAKDSEERQNRSESPGRFLENPQVLSRCVLPSGRHYWEVEWNQKGRCEVGVSYPSIERDGDESGTGCNDNSWCLILKHAEYSLLYNQVTETLHLKPTCPIIGVFLDYEAGRLSFYELGDPIIFLDTFTTSFTEPLKVIFYIDNEASVKIRS